MTINEYQKLAMTTLNPALEKRDVLINSVMGLCGEAGEVIDHVKKWHAQGHELDREVLKKELGAPFLFLSGGECSIHRRLGMKLGCCMSLCVYEHYAGSTPSQPLLRIAKTIRDDMGF